MGFDINKYNDRRFHSDELTHKRIKTLLLWYEHKVYQKKYLINERLQLLANIIKVTVDQEWYEISAFFEELKLKTLLEDL